jgi:hypothetical protein
MALKKLTIEEMNQISAPWVTKENPARVAIEKVPMLAALLPQLEAAHAGIFALRAQVEDPKIRALSDRQSALDADHDERVRGIHGALTGLAQVSGASTELLSLRDELFPEGLGHTQMTYRGQAGHGAMVAAHLDAKLQARLKAVNLHDKNLLDLTNEWLGVAKQIGDLEDERARLSPPPTPSADINNARLAWVRITNALLANAELAGIDSATDHLLFAPLRAAEKTADSRGKSKPTSAPAATTTTTAPVTPATTAP